MSEESGVYGAGGQRRDAVDFNEVCEACYRLMRRGERPSVRTVRNELNGGSPNTISEHLQTFWKTLVPPADHAQHALGVFGIPQEAFNYITKTWEILTTKAQRLAAIDLSEQQRAANSKQVELLASREISSLRERALAEDYLALRERCQDLDTQLSRARIEHGELLQTIQLLREKLTRQTAQREMVQRELESERAANTQLRQRTRVGRPTSQANRTQNRRLSRKAQQPKKKTARVKR